MGQRLTAGAVVGASLSAVLVAVSYLGWKLAGLPFAPFDLFDGLARALPGSIVTFGIDSAVVVLRAFHAGSTAAAAKSAEQAVAIAGFVLAGSLIGAAAFFVLHLSGEPGRLLGVVLGSLLGTGMLLVERNLRRLDGALHVDAVSTVAAFLMWGLALGWLHDVWHELLPTAPSPTSSSLDRRGFLLRVAWIAGLPTALTAVWDAAIGRRRVARGARWSDSHPLPNAGSLVAPVPGTRAEFTPLEDHYRIDVDTRAPVVDVDRWHLRIAGMVDRSVELTLADLLREEPLHQFVTLACISNPLGGDLVGTTRWSGVSLRRLLSRVQVQAGATHLKVRSADGFFEVLALAAVQADPRVMLAYAWDDEPLAMEHGFPLRVYIPDVYGMKQPKWVEAIEVVNRWEPGYWVARGWDRDGVMKATAVVDAADGKSVGGIAHAGARGVSRVEVRVDGGEWREARLREPLSDTTWVLWRADLSATDGSHVVTARCYDGDGTPQAPPFHSKRVSLRA